MRKALIVLFVVAAVMVIATPPLAGTKIKNQAAATFVDHLGVNRNVLSNQVVTTILPVYSVNVSPDSIDLPGAPGGEMTFQYIVENLGNDVDSYTVSTEIATGSTFTPVAVEVFYDENGNGVVDPGENHWNDLTVNIPAGESRSLLIRYTIPSNATSDATASVLLDVVSNTDATAYDNNNEANSVVYQDAVVTAFKSVSPDQAAAGDSITYTISGGNVGTKIAYAVTITDPLPDDIVFDSFGSISPAAASYGYDSGSHTVTVVFTSLDAGSNYSIEINARVSETAQSGNVANMAHLTYKLSDNSTEILRDSNYSILKVGGTGYETAEVWIGPDGVPEATGSNDQQVETGIAGALITFVNTIKNSGNSTDTLNIEIVNVDPESLTDSFAFSFYLDELVPLPDSNDDGYQDVGPVGPGESVDLVVKVYIPSDVAESITDATATIRVISSLDPSSSDTTLDIVRPIVRPAVDMGNASGTAFDTEVSEVSVVETALPGGYVDFPLDVVNNGGGSDSFALSADLPDGWLVRFYIDLNGDGVLTDDELTPITSTGSISEGSGIRIIARVVVSEDALYTGNNEAVTFRAVSANNPDVSDSITNYIRIEPVYGILLAPSRNGSGAPGTVVSYVHTLRNSGNVSENIELVISSTLGWTATLLDPDGNVVPLDTVFTLDPEEAIDLTLRFSIPSDAPLGITDIAYLTAVVQEEPTVSSTITDITFVTSANVIISKTVDKAEAKPGEVITYTVTYQNTGIETVTEFVLYDVIPFFTKLYDGTFTPDPTGYSTNYGGTWTTGWPPADFETVTNLKWYIGNLNPGDSGSVTFQVVVEQ